MPQTIGGGSIVKGFRNLTYLVTGSGILSLSEIGNIAGPSTQPIDLEVATDLNDKTATEFLVGSNTTVVRIDLESGLQLDVHPAQQIKTFKGNGISWVAASGLQVGDFLPYRVGGYSNLSDFKDLTAPAGGFQVPSTLNEDVGWFLGCYFGGGTDITDGISISGRVLELCRVIHMIDAVFDIESTSLSIDPGTVPLKYRTGTIEVVSTQLVSFLSTNGLLKGNPNTARIPKLLRQSPISVIKNFLAGFHISTNGAEPGVRELRTPSAVMALGLAVCIRAVGNDARVVPDTTYLIEYDLDRVERNEARNTFNLYPDRVKAVSSANLVTYDLTIDGDEYLANSYSSRNT